MSDSNDDKPDVPAPTLWPIGFSIGIACILVGLVVSWPAVVLGAAITIVFGLLWIRDTARSHAPVDSAAAHELVGDTPSAARAAAEEQHLETYGRAGFLTLATLGLGGVIGAGGHAAVTRFRGAPVVHGRGSRHERRRPRPDLELPGGDVRDHDVHRQQAPGRCLEAHGVHQEQRPERRRRSRASRSLQPLRPSRVPGAAERAQVRGQGG